MFFGILDNFMDNEEDPYHGVRLKKFVYDFYHELDLNSSVFKNQEPGIDFAIAKLPGKDPENEFEDDDSNSEYSWLGFYNDAKIVEGIIQQYYELKRMLNTQEC